MQVIWNSLSINWYLGRRLLNHFVNPRLNYEKSLKGIIHKILKKALELKPRLAQIWIPDMSGCLIHMRWLLFYMPNFMQFNALKYFYIHVYAPKPELYQDETVSYSNIQSQGDKT